MQFSVLGSLQVVGGDGDELIVVSAPRLRVLLAVLLWRANQPVPSDELAEMIWDGAPPAGPAAAVRALVKRLRQVLGERAGARIVTRAPSYMIKLSGDELDASRFEMLSRDACPGSRSGAAAGARAAAAPRRPSQHGQPSPVLGGRPDAARPRPHAGTPGFPCPLRYHSSPRAPASRTPGP